ncbi:hypothetical protein QE152_g515 [Popillia japonica]|uniref:Microtubule-associated protein Jupiter n=1 Tax=Popillia japonica TaxID=7064 RepID=A0AAW1NE97_POPJA
MTDMTSTEFNVGLSDGRCSSRVLKPPGGGHSQIFGWSDEPCKQRTKNNSSEIKDCFQHEPEKKIAVEPEKRKEESEVEGRKQEDVTVPEKKTDIPQRVRVPPGGFSSGLW